METTALGTRLYVGIMDERAAPMHKYLYFTVLLKTDRKPLFKPNWWEQHSHAEYRPRLQMSDCCWKTPDHFFDTWSAKASTHISPYQQSYQWSVLHPQKLMSSTSQTSPVTKLNSSQGPTELMKSPFMRDGVSLWVKNSGIYVLRLLGFWLRYRTTTHWNSDSVSLTTCFILSIKFKGSTKSYTYQAFQKALGTFSFAAPQVCLDSSVFKHLGNDFKVWISSIGLVT